MTDRPPLEIACDESGYEGEKLIGGTTDVFAHGSVHLDLPTAKDCVTELRRRIRSPATEYKANHLLREKHRAVLTWFLGPSGPVLGNAHVYLVDRAFFVVSRVIELFADEVDHGGVGVRQSDTARAVSVLLYEARRTFPPEHWQAFLISANDLMRTKDRLDVATPADSFFSMVDLLRAGADAQVGEILRLLSQARPRAEAFRAKLLGNPEQMPTLDPLVRGIARAVQVWGAGGQPVAVVHDRQNLLSETRITQLMEVFGRQDPALPDEPTWGRLTSLELVDSLSDARIQVADFLAGTARKIAQDALNGHADAELTGLLRPYVDPCSVWGDDSSWARLRTR